GWLSFIVEEGVARGVEPDDEGTTRVEGTLPVGTMCAPGGRGAWRLKSRQRGREVPLRGLSGARLGGRDGSRRLEGSPSRPRRNGRGRGGSGGGRFAEPCGRTCWRGSGCRLQG